jgi:hypothetical protein
MCHLLSPRSSFRKKLGQSTHWRNEACHSLRSVEARDFGRPGLRLATMRPAATFATIRLCARRC